MKNSEFKELSAQELEEFDGGWLDFAYELLTGRNLAQDLRSVGKAAAAAYVQTIQEGGTTSSQMPFP